MPLSQQGTGQGYQNASTAYVEGHPWSYRVVVTRPELASRFISAWEEGDDLAIGEMLGFPECCREFYQWSWKKHGFRDVALTSTVGEEAIDKLDFQRNLTIVGNYQNNVFLRHLGLRMVSHLPCSMTCQASVKVADSLLTVTRKAEMIAEMHWLKEILSWPFKWSSLHGVAILTTPVLKLVYNTDALSESVEISKEGSTYPAEGGRGPFPFQETVQLVNDYSDNGFSSQDAMNNAHAMIVEAALTLRIPPGAQVLDLGCGNGRLLEAITDVSGAIPVGVELHKPVHKKAAKRLSRHNGVVHQCDIFDHSYWSGHYHLALVAINRLFEARPEQAREFLRRLKVHCDHVIFYTYVSDVWTGYIGLTNDFVLEKFLRGQNSCAALMRPMNVEEFKEIV
jgi:hypothetical protein